jgi:hypothetical protein
MNSEKEQGSILGYLVLLIVVLGVVRATRTPAVVEIGRGAMEGAPPQGSAEVAAAPGAGQL